MPYTLLSSASSVQVFSPTLVSDALVCTIASAPSGATLIRTIPQASFTADQGAGILSSLSNAVESILLEGIAIDASGTQGVDASGLIYDAVLFTVQYVPPEPIPGAITGTVEVPVNVITADTQFGSFLTGGTAQERILDEYNRLKTLAGD